jgi:hypothetical protein
MQRFEALLKRPHRHAGFPQGRPVEGRYWLGQISLVPSAP